MSPTVTLKGAVKFGLKKLVAGGEIGHSTFTGPGEILLAPHSLGDITNIRLDGGQLWSIARDGYLCSTQGIVKDYKSQGLTKGMFSGEGLFIYKVSGSGIVFITSMGAIIRKDVRVSQFGFKLTITVARRREVYCRQRSSSCMELRVYPRARCIWRHHLRYCIWGRVDLQVPR
jgi:uncharacterized protein (AIM24 family)